MVLQSIFHCFTKISRDAEYREVVLDRQMRMIVDKTERFLTANETIRKNTSHKGPVNDAFKSTGNIRGHPEGSDAEFGYKQITKEILNAHTQKMDRLRSLWVMESRSFTRTSSAPKPCQGAPIAPPRGLRALRSYEIYHAETVSLLVPFKRDFDIHMNRFLIKSWRKNSRWTSERDKMVEAKNGNSIVKMVEKLTTPTALEIGDQAFREEEAYRAMDKGEEESSEEVIRR